MKQKKTFLEFCTDLRGKKFVDDKNREVFKYVLYWTGERVDQLLYNRTKYKCKNNI